MVDLLWEPTGMWQQGLIYGGTRLVDKKKKSLTFETLCCGLELLGATRESGICVFSIDQMNQRKKNPPRAQSIYQRTGEAPWGSIRKSWPEVFVVTPPQEKLRYE
jgi:hypothetical protein